MDCLEIAFELIKLILLTGRVQDPQVYPDPGVVQTKQTEFNEQVYNRRYYKFSLKYSPLCSLRT